MDDTSDSLIDGLNGCLIDFLTGLPIAGRPSSMVGPPGSWLDRQSDGRTDGQVGRMDRRGDGGG